MPIKMSKDGATFYDVDDTPESLQAAEAKGYRQYMDVTKDGKDTYTIEATTDSVKAATDKGYVSTQAFTNRQATPPNLTKGHSFAAGMGETLGMGALDEVSAGVESALTDKTYDQALAENQRYNNQAQTANPATYGAGQATGAAASMAVPGLNAAKGASALAAAGRSAGVGAATGFMGADGGLENRLKGAGIGVAVGGLAGGVGQGIGKANLQNPTARLANASEDAALAVGEGIEKAGTSYRDKAQGVIGWATAPISKPIENVSKTAALASGDWASKLLTKASSVADPAFNKFAPVLQGAAQRGPAAVSATHYLLQQKDPEYREFVRRNEGDQ